MNPRKIDIKNFNYELPDERIAKFPLPVRSDSKLLFYNAGEITETKFENAPKLLPDNTLLVFNNTRVIRARLEFHKQSGARIEIFLLDPHTPQDYALSLSSQKECSWNCLVGNSAKWKEGFLELPVKMSVTEVILRASRVRQEGKEQIVTFSWDGEYTFAEIIESAGVLPIPPYLNRETEESDLKTYQTVYSKIKGSVAAPTAGLHFTPEVIDEIKTNGTKTAEVTLHVGAGTFLPVKSQTVEGHSMHSEVISVDIDTIRTIAKYTGKVIAVGTTTVRTLESLYYIGEIVSSNPNIEMRDIKVEQWSPYTTDDEQPARPETLSPQDSLLAIADYLDRCGERKLIASTRIIIAPGYKFHIIDGMFTNFHQPQSTLLLLISALVGDKWKDIYNYAMNNGFRFLSYGDSSLLLP